MKFFAFAIALFALIGCGDTSLKESRDETPIGAAANGGDFAVSGRSAARLYLNENDLAWLTQTTGELPIVITDGKNFTAQIDGSLSGKKIYLEVGGTTREILVEVEAGETQFIAP
jgi:hypothetical protein